MDLEQRVTALEAEMRMVRQEAAGARALAAGADQDVAEYRAELRQHTRMLNALRETQVEQGAAIIGLRTDVDGLRAGVDGLRTGVDGLRTDVDGLRTDVDGLRTGVDNLRAETERRFDQVQGGLATITRLLEGLTDPPPSSS